MKGLTFNYVSLVSMNCGKLKTLLIIILFILINLFDVAEAQTRFVSKKENTGAALIDHVINRTQDSISLTAFVRNLYKWHRLQIPFDKGFDPKKDHPSDTLYKGIDFEAIDFMIRKLRTSGYFDDTFLRDYRSIALRMDNELRKGTSTWQEGALPPFNGTQDPWCDCDDNSVKYWPKIKLSILRFSKNEVDFKWTSGGAFLYQMKAKKAKGNWKITYMEGFDTSHYKWAQHIIR